MSDHSTPAPTRGGLAPRLTLLLVVALFVVPILVAWWYARIAPPGEGTHLVNHGLFIEPPLDIRHDDDMAPLREFTLAPGEWAMLYFTDGACEEACNEAAGLLDAIRTVIGRDATRVRIAAVADSAPQGAPRHRISSPRRPCGRASRRRPAPPRVAWRRPRVSCFSTGEARS